MQAVLKVARTQRRHGEVSVYKPADSRCWYFRVQIHGKRFNRSTGQTTRPAALAQARIIARELAAGGGARETMRRPGFATIGDVLDVWGRRATHKSASAAATAFAKMVREVTGSADVRAVCVSRVTGKAFAEWLGGYQGSPKGRHSTWATVRSIYQKAALRWYEDAGLCFPAELVKGFRAVPSGGRATVPGGFIAIPRATLAAMDAAAVRLRFSPALHDRKIWTVYYLMRWCGLRNSEVAELRWRWIDESGQFPRLWFMEDAAAGYVPKGKPGAVPISRLRLARLRRVFAPGERDEEFVLPRAHRSEAAEYAERHINGFVGEFVRDRSKTAYELRKQFGSEVADRHDIATASAWLRHGSITTTMGWYHAQIRQMRPM